MNYYDLISLILTQLHERINSDEFLERFRRPNSFVRYRKLTLKQVVAYLIHSKKRSMDIELSDLQRQLPDIDFTDEAGCFKSQKRNSAGSFQRTFG